MKKKIIKYIKCALAATLIMSLTLPSYAAVNSADGSAFVTKAEFDAALSDFNARLTTFEAGINSKIDSQVSSYLDRNGIWNGKAQTILIPEFTINSGNQWSINNGLTSCWSPGNLFVANKSGLLMWTIVAAKDSQKLQLKNSSSAWPGMGMYLSLMSQDDVDRTKAHGSMRMDYAAREATLWCMMYEVVVYLSNQTSNLNFNADRGKSFNPFAFVNSGTAYSLYVWAVSYYDSALFTDNKKWITTSLDIY